MEVWLATRLLKKDPQLYKPWYLDRFDTEAYFPDIISDISEWLTFLLFAVFSSTYFPEFRDLGVEMICFSGDYKRKRERATDSRPMLNHKDNESCDEYWTLTFFDIEVLRSYHGDKGKLEILFEYQNSLTN